LQRDEYAMIKEYDFKCYYIFSGPVWARGKPRFRLIPSLSHLLLYMLVYFTFLFPLFYTPHLPIN